MKKKDEFDLYSKLPHVLARCGSVSLRAFRVFGYLLSFSPCFPSYRAIRAATGLSNETITKAIKELVVRKMIAYTKGGTKSGSNEYFILPVEQWDLSKFDKEVCQIFDEAPSKYRSRAFQILESNKNNLIKINNKNNSNSRSHFLKTSDCRKASDHIDACEDDSHLCVDDDEYYDSPGGDSSWKSNNGRGGGKS